MARIFVGVVGDGRVAQITIYTRMMCGYCGRALSLLRSKDVEVTVIDAGFNVEKRREMIQRANGAATYPQIFIGDVHVGGSDELQALERAGKLDPLIAGMT